MQKAAILTRSRSPLSSAPLNPGGFAINQLAQTLIAEEFAFAFEHELFGEGLGYIKEVEVAVERDARHLLAS